MPEARCPMPLLAEFPPQSRVPITHPRPGLTERLKFLGEAKGISDGHRMLQGTGEGCTLDEVGASRAAACEAESVLFVRGLERLRNAASPPGHEDRGAIGK